MSVVLTCPACGCQGDIEGFLADADGKRLAALFAGCDPALGRAIIGYLRLFKPPKQALRLPRAVRIVAELIDLVESGTVCRDDRTNLIRAANPALWAQGIEQLQEQRARLSLPLANHHYLRAVVFGLADQAAARAETKAEEAKRSGQHRRSAPGIPADVETALQRAIGFVRQMHGYGRIDDAERDRQIAELREKHSTDPAVTLPST